MQFQHFAKYLCLVQGSDSFASLEETKAMIKLISSVIWSGIVNSYSDVTLTSQCDIQIAYINFYLTTREISLKFENVKFRLWSLQKVQGIRGLSFIVDKPFLLIKLFKIPD